MNISQLEVEAFFHEFLRAANAAEEILCTLRYGLLGICLSLLGIALLIWKRRSR